MTFCVFNCFVCFSFLRSGGFSARDSDGAAQQRVAAQQHRRQEEHDEETHLHHKLAQISSTDCFDCFVLLFFVALCRCLSNLLFIIIIYCILFLSR
jgi:hypothetical protein